MNTIETRQLGIEFERRVHQLLPHKEFLDKMDTETIYSFLNQYQDKLIHNTFLKLDKLAPSVQPSSRTETLLKELVKTEYPNEISKSGNRVLYSYPQDFALYIKSTSYVTSYYRMNKDDYSIINPKPVKNELVPNIESSEYIIAPNDTMKIMRTPVITLESEGIRLVHDNFTDIARFELTYYKNPQYFSPLTNTDCELPIDLFDDLVTGAVALYTQYIVGLNKKEDKEKDED